MNKEFFFNCNMKIIHKLVKTNLKKKNLIDYVPAIQSSINKAVIGESC